MSPPSTTAKTANHVLTEVMLKMAPNYHTVILNRQSNSDLFGQTQKGGGIKQMNLSFCTFSFSHCVVCRSSIYGFWLPLCYLHTLLEIIEIYHSFISLKLACLYLYCRCRSSYQWGGESSLTSLALHHLFLLSEVRIWIPIAVCRGLFCVQLFDMRGDWSFCCYWWNYWPQTYKLSSLKLIGPDFLSF